MATIEPRRRRSDSRPPRPRPFGPTPAAWGPPDPDGFTRSLEIALDAARKGRRSLTLVMLDVEVVDGIDPERAFVAVASLVRRTVRESDGVWRDAPLRIAVLLADTDGPSAEPALARIRLRLRSEHAPRVTMGRAAAQPGIDAAALVELARADGRPVVH